MRLQNLAVLLFFWISILSTCTFLAESSYEACEPRNCGSGPNISFPFYVDGVGTENCGQQGFKILCNEQNMPIFQTTRGPYLIKDISYQNQSIVLVDLDNLNASCFAPKHYFIFDLPIGDPFNFSSSHTNLQFFYNCNTSLSSPYDKSLVPCASNTTHPSYVALIPDDDDMGDPGGACESQVAVPVDEKQNWPSNQTIRNVNYTELLLDGFSLVWNKDTSCGECSSSGGRCGTQDQARVCFCPDGSSNSKRCNGSTSTTGKKESSYEACEPINCGSGPNISFPFYVDGAGTENCGLQGFKILCNKQNMPIFQTTRGPYLVKDISYQDQSIVLVDLDNLNVSCFAPKHYFIFDLPQGDPFDFRSSHTNLQFFYKCNPSLSSPYDKSLVPCASNTTHPSYVALIPDDDDMGDPWRACESQVAVPVDAKPNWPSTQTIKNVNYTELLLDGFILVWNEDTRCGECSTSGGRCGTQGQARVCFCPDGSSNSKLCNGSTSTTGKKGEQGNRLVVKAIIGITVLGVLAVIIILCCLRKKLFWKKQNQAHRNVEAFLRNYGPLQVRRYSYLEVKKMTNSFSEKLGQGGYGSVYKGNLLDGPPVAVKILDKSEGDDGEEFMNEVATISRTSHVNVVTLLGFCFEGTKRTLIYEFMPNGSLEKFIFDKSPTENRHRQLDWEILYRISLGIARGLEYLHRGCNTQILHFDIKPHNVLLDGDFVPKISDFGLAKMNNRDVSLVSMQGPRGTAGYIAPEIFSRSFGGVSHKSDVYSYGMMVLDMVGGRENVNIRADNTSEICFPQWIYERIQLNEELGLERLVEEEDNVKVKKMIMVSLWCIQIAPSNRPAMNKVIEMLEGNLESLQVPPKPILWSSASTSVTLSSLNTFVSSET